MIVNSYMTDLCYNLFLYIMSFFLVRGFSLFLSQLCPIPLGKKPTRTILSMMSPGPLFGVVHSCEFCCFLPLLSNHLELWGPIHIGVLLGIRRIDF